MLALAPAEILIRDRQRRSMNRAALDDLRASIEARGLLHALIVRPDGRDYVLVAGERRLAAIREIFASGNLILYSGEPFTSTIPVTVLSDPTEINVAAAEAEENLMREDLNWVDQTRALALIAELAAERGQPDTEVAESLEERGVSVGPSKTAGSIAKSMSQARALKPHLDDPEIAKSRNAGEAYQKLMKREQEAINAIIAKRAAPTNATLHLGDALTLMPDMEAGQFDLILTDPPYGIRADAGGFRSKSPQAHEYADDPATAKAVQQAILLEGWRLSKAQANIIMFCDVDNLDWLKACCHRVGWEYFRTPIIWNKSQTEGISPWGSNGFLRTYEMIFFATKGQRGLLRSLPDILFANRVPRSKRVFAAQKPYSLLHQLIGASTLEGDTVFDPCAGSGSTLRAARMMKRSAVGIELSESTYNAALGFINTDADEDEDSATSTTIEDIA